MQIKRNASTLQRKRTSRRRLKRLKQLAGFCPTHTTEFSQEASRHIRRMTFKPLRLHFNFQMIAQRMISRRVSMKSLRAIPISSRTLDSLDCSINLATEMALTMEMILPLTRILDLGLPAISLRFHLRLQFQLHPFHTI